MNLGLAPILFILVVSMTAVKSQIRKGPVNALKRVGDSVTLECVTEKKNCDQVEWSKVEGLQSPKLVYRNGNGNLNNDVYPTQRYSVNESYGCNLTITQLVIGDSGRFICVHAVGDGEKTRSSILVVISVAESCLSNVKSYVLDEGDGYSLRCAINIPPKSVEPSNVTLSFHNKTVCETETTDENQQLTVRTTLIGTAANENITRVCRASIPPRAEANYDITTAFLDVCTTQWIVSYPVENIAVSLVPSTDDTVRCTADGHPPPTFKWTHGKSGAEVDGDILVIKGDAGDKYTCTATNTFKGTPVSRSVPYEVVVTPPPPPPPCLLSAPGCGPGCVVSVFFGCLICGGVIGYASYAGLKDEGSPLYVRLHSRKKKNDYPVANILISVSLPGPDKDITVRCTADGHPPPTFKWKHLESGKVVDGDTLVITGDTGGDYTCTATNTVNGKETSQDITIEFTSPPPEDNGKMGAASGTQDPKVAGCGPGGIVTGTIIGSGVIRGVSFVVWRRSEKEDDEKDERANDLSNDLTSASLSHCRTCEASEVE